MRWVMALAVLPLLAGDAPRLIYSKSFPHSSPEYMEILIEHNGEGLYKEAVDDNQPLKFPSFSARPNSSLASLSASWNFSG